MMEKQAELAAFDLREKAPDALKALVSAEATVAGARAKICGLQQICDAK